MASGLGGIALFIIGVLTTKLYLGDSTLASQENSQFVLLVLSILLPSVIIFWSMDHTRKYFLSGDSGSMFLAFMIATLAIISGGKVATVASVLGVYIVDAFYVILVRLYNKKNPLKGDMIHHLHFRLMNLGFSHNFIRGTIYTLAFICGMSAVFLDKVGKSILAVFLVLIVFFVTRILAVMKKDEE
jgi:UDP-GlcNAc:undecaprenyl-phosphate GlcNAc-1-phosphate transferase